VLSPAADLRYYARGAFAAPSLTLPDAPLRSWWRPLKPGLFGAAVIAHSLADYPARWMSGRR
jgi:hypothetical protein